MRLEIKNNNFIEIEDLIKVNSIECILDEYSYDNGTLKGVLKFQGEYLKDSSSFDAPFNFLKYIPIEIVFVEDIKMIKEVKIELFEYFEVERRGIETETTLLIKDEEEREVINDLEEENNEIENLNHDYDDIKDNVQTEIDNILDQTFNIESNDDDNNKIFPTKTNRTKIKIIGSNK